MSAALSACSSSACPSSSTSQERFVSRFSLPHITSIQSDQDTVCVLLQEGRCAYAIAIMAVYWMTEALPMAATALFPIMLFPFLGVLSSKELCANYLKVRVS